MLVRLDERSLEYSKDMYDDIKRGIFCTVISIIHFSLNPFMPSVP